MSNRVIIGALPGGGYGIRVSRPGANAENNNLPGNQVSFDSRWIGSSRVLLAGNVSVASGAATTIMFGETLSTAPALIAMRWPNSGSIRYWEPLGSAVSSTVTVGSTSPAVVNPALLPENSTTEADVRTDRVILRNTFGVAVTISYILLRL